MAKFMIKAEYNVDGIKGLIKDGGTGRRTALTRVLESLGGKLEAFYFAYGEHDNFIIADVPDTTSGIALSLAVNASGAIRVSLVPLITPEEMDAACKRPVVYRAPGA